MLDLPVSLLINHFGIKLCLLWLGGFHTLMSFLGSIGHVMSGSGIDEVLEQVFATNVVPHILSGKAFARAVRGHMLIHSALLRIVLEQVIDLQLISHEDLLTLSNFSDGDEMDLYSCLEAKVNSAFSQWKESFTDYKTAQYWIQYMQYIAVVKSYIRAERTGNWPLHLSCVKDMLNLFAATGHIHYTKSARLYLQQMLDLQINHPEVHNSFVESGYHATH